MQSVNLENKKESKSFTFQTLKAYKNIVQTVDNKHNRFNPLLTSVLFHDVMDLKE
jgi:hypothetical protein